MPANVEKKISDIKVGDIVLGFDLINNKFVPTEVKVIHQHETSLVVKIEVFDTIIYATPEHLFYDMHRNTIKAIDIGKGTMLLCRDGKLKMVQSAELIHKPCTVYNFETGCHTYIADDFITHNCNLNCSYCYQKDKTAARKMSVETGKKIVDLLYRMWDENKPGAFINQDTKMIILDFIGGEPMLYTDVMDQIVSYFWQTAIIRRHPWAETFMISIATNGTLHFKPEVQKFIYKYKGHLSYGVSIDGPKDMHDACRVYYDGRGSFDDANAAQEDYNKHFQAPSGTKATIARANLPYLSRLIKYYVGKGYQQIHANYVYEEEWNNEDALLLYNQMDEISDYILSLPFPVELSLFDDRYFTPMDEEDNRNWCGGTGAMVAFDPVGKAYPCIRYMDSSLAGDMPGLVIGDTDGIWDERYQEVTDAMNAVTRRSQSTDECFYCPIASGCSWCSGWNYQSEGSFNKRSTRICPMHKARSLACVKHFNKLYLKNGDKKTFHRYLPDEEALKIISQKELDLLNKLEEQTKKLAPEGYDQRNYRFCSI